MKDIHLFQRLKDKGFGLIGTILTLSALTFVTYEVTTRLSKNATTTKSNKEMVFSSKAVSKGILSYTIYALKERWCMDANWGKDNACSSTKNMQEAISSPFNLERLLWSDSTTSDIIQRYFGLYKIYPAIPPQLNKITHVITLSQLETLGANHPLNLIVDDNVKKCIDTVTINIEKQNAADLKPQGDEVYLKITLEGDSGFKILSACSKAQRSFKIQSLVVLYPRTLNQFSLIKVLDLDVRSLASTSGKGISFNGPVYVQGDLILPASNQNVNFRERVKIGEGIVKNDNVAFTTNTFGGANDLYINQLPTVGGFFGGIGLESERDGGLSNIFNPTYVYPTNTNMPECTHRQKLKDDLQYTKDSRLYIKPALNNLPNNYRIGLSLENEFRDYNANGLSPEGYLIYDQSLSSDAYDPINNDTSTNLYSINQYYTNYPYRITDITNASLSPIMETYFKLYNTSGTLLQSTKILMGRDTSFEIKFAQESFYNSELKKINIPITSYLDIKTLNTKGYAPADSSSPPTTEPAMFLKAYSNLSTICNLKANLAVSVTLQACARVLTAAVLLTQGSLNTTSSSGTSSNLKKLQDAKAAADAKLAADTLLATAAKLTYDLASTALKAANTVAVTAGGTLTSAQIAEAAAIKAAADAAIAVTTGATTDAAVLAAAKLTADAAVVAATNAVIAATAAKLAADEALKVYENSAKLAADKLALSTATDASNTAAQIEINTAAASQLAADNTAAATAAAIANAQATLAAKVAADALTVADNAATTAAKTAANSAALAAGLADGAAKTAALAQAAADAIVATDAQIALDAANALAVATAANATQLAANQVIIDAIMLVYNIYFAEEQIIIKALSDLSTTPPSLIITTASVLSNQEDWTFEFKNKDILLKNVFLQHLKKINLRSNFYDFGIEGSPLKYMPYGRRTRRSMKPGPNDPGPGLVDDTLSNIVNFKIDHVGNKINTLTYDNQLLDNKIKLSPWAIIKNDNKADSYSEPPGNYYNSNQIVYPENGLTNAAAKLLDDSCAKPLVAEAPNWDISFTDTTQFSWLYNLTSSGVSIQDGRVVTPALTHYFSPNDTFPGNYVGVPTRSVVIDCYIGSDVTFVFGFYVCQNLHITARTLPLNIVGTFIIQNFILDPKVSESGINFYSIWQKEAIDLLQKNSNLRKENIIPASGDTSCNFPKTSGWNPMLTDESNADLLACSPAKFLYDGANNFNWSTVDPELGIASTAINQSTTQSKVVNRYRRFNYNFIWQKED